ncbi:hypothetical protein RO07_23260 [Pandoraea pulmonicola]|uniref:Uncharacterized protein n=1 Tax=Pandoraea pulmonicola TaxID=93221 RepID=A0ABM5S4F7_PANPU|nr:hypothetical protein RO07_23260 [Pandoraea pulmonicola]
MTPCPIKIRAKVITDETLLAIQAAVEAAQTAGQGLNKAALAAALGVARETLIKYVTNDELTVAARNRLAVINGECTSSKGKMSDDALLALAAEVKNCPFNAAEFARRHNIPRSTVRNYVRLIDRGTRRSELTSWAQSRMKGLKMRTLRPNARLESDYWRALKSAVGSGRPPDAATFADNYAMLPDQVRSDIKILRLLQDHAALQSTEPERMESTAPAHLGSTLRCVEPRDLRALRDERACGGPFERMAWAQRLGLSIYSVCKYVTREGELTVKGLNLLHAG